MPKVRKLTPEEIARIEQEERFVTSRYQLDTPTPQGGQRNGERFPAIAAWATSGGWIEIGYEHYTNAFIRVLDTGGLVWEGEEEYPTLDDALADAEQALIRLEEEGEI
jgi:hypothetical protein